MAEWQLTRRRIAPAAILLIWLVIGNALAQELEPRRWAHLPVNLNIVGAGLGATDGEITLDPVLRIEDGTFELYTAGGSYIRTFEWLGKSSRVDIRLPYATGRWEGLLDGAPASIRREGFGDPSIRFSMSLLGSPPLAGKDFLQYRASHPVANTLGVGLSLTLPWGDYLPGRLINLGGNRYVVRPQIGFLHQHGPWQLELTTSVSLFETNDAFYGGTRLEQDPLWFIQGHVIRSFPRSMWASLSGGYSYGGESRINGVPKNNDERTRYFALSLGMALGNHQAIKITYVNANTNVILGTSSDSLIFSWTTAWSD